MRRRTWMLRAAVVAASGACVALAAFAQDTAAPAASQAMSEGEVRKVDAENRKLTLRHGPLANLDMPAMTMVFQVQDESMLQRVHVGDKVRFTAEKIDGKFTVVRLEPAAP